MSAFAAGAVASGVSMAESVARAIEREIEGGALLPSSLIGTKDQLQSRFNVARGTLNEAIQLLRSRDLVDLRPGPKGGIFVARPSPLARFGSLLLGLRDSSDLTVNCFAVKDALDPWVAADAARFRTAADVRDVRQILRRMKAAIPDHRAFGEGNWELHRRIAAICPNAVMRALYCTIVDVIKGEVTDAQGAHDFNRSRFDVHHRLVEAIAAGDDAAAFRIGGEEHRIPLMPAPSDAGRPKPPVSGAKTPGRTTARRGRAES